MKLLKYFLFRTQLILLNLSYKIFIQFSKVDKTKIVLGVEEIASFLHNSEKALGQNAVSICFYKTSFYKFSYSVDWSQHTFLSKVKRLILGPILLGKLAANYKNFLYFGSLGFIISDFDGRKAEFAFLKQHNKSLQVIFLGSEIRSQKLLSEYGIKHKIDTIITYQQYINKSIASNEKEKKRRLLANVSDRYADTIYSAVVDQMSYITKPQVRIPYFYPDNNFKENMGKWQNITKLKILHCPSSPIIKGTPIIRAAIKKLKLDGYNFSYLELTDVTHEKIIEELKESHIVINQLYAHVPSVFGIEAMANNALLMTSADENVELTLPPMANSAWVVSPYWDFYAVLKNVLDTPMDELAKQALSYLIY